MKSEDAFTTHVLAACSEMRSLGYSPVRFEQMVRTLGAVGAAKRLIGSADLQSGIKTLAGLSRLDLSIEAMMLDSRFLPLFSRQEQEAARWRLTPAEAIGKAENAIDG